MDLIGELNGTWFEKEKAHAERDPNSGGNIVLHGYAMDDIFSRFHYRNENISGFTKHFKESLFSISEKKLFSVELLLWDGNLLTGEHRVYLIVHNDEDKDVAGADV